MDFAYIDSHQMKENMDINLMHLNKSFKGADQKLVKRQLFKEIEPQTFVNKIKKTAYIVDSEQESPVKCEVRSGKRMDGSPQSIDGVSQIIESISRDVSFHTSPKAPLTLISTCHQHSQQIYTYNYCIQCSTYLLCPSCIKTSHSGHMILTFSSQSESKCLTKQFLIEKIEETLQRLKSKENDLKNKSTELELITVNVKKMEEEVMDKLEGTFRYIGNMIRTVYEKEQELYENRIDQFYQGYNSVGDSLRQSLLSIIDESFDIHTFTPSLLVKQPPTVPNQQISRFKSTLEKTKKFYKSIIESLDELRQKTEQFSNLSCKNSKATIVTKKKAAVNKYEKFLSDNCFNDNGQQAKSSLIRILDTLSR